MLQLQKIIKQPLHGTIALPISKSIANRLLMIRALSGRVAEIRDIPHSRDVQILKLCLEKHEGDCFFEDAGTPLRMYLAYASLKGNGKRIIDGFERLRQRPIRELLEALESAGAQFEFLEKPYHLPLKVVKTIDRSCSEFKIKGSVSSQFISALMLIAPSFEKTVRILLTDAIRSAPYVQMTALMMQQFGIEHRMYQNCIEIEPGIYQQNDVEIESDWSAAAFLYSHLAVSGQGELLLKGLRLPSLQGDSKVAEIFEPFGVKTSLQDGFIKIEYVKQNCDFIELDVKDVPDMFPALCATAIAMRIPAVFKGVKNLRDKESDRIHAMQEASLGIGAVFRMLNEDELSIEYTEKVVQILNINTHGDHRIAMACSVFAYLSDIVIDNEMVVKKSFSGFWDVYAALHGNFTKEITE